MSLESFEDDNNSSKFIFVDANFVIRVEEMA
jgi:hypothetical protein